MRVSKKIIANDWVQLRELLNKVWDLGLVLLIGCSGGAHKSQERVGFRRGYRAFDLMWTRCVVLHDSWCVGWAVMTKPFTPL